MNQTCKHNKKIYSPFKPWYMSKVLENCKHNQIKTKCTKCFELHGNTTNHIGKTFGKLRVISFSGMKKYGKERPSCVMAGCTDLNHAFKLCEHHYYLYKKYKKEEPTPFEVKFGKSCFFCGKRKQIFAASNGAEGGRDSICTCK